MIPVSGVVPICGHRVAPPDMLEVFRSSTQPLQRRRSLVAPASRPERARLYLQEGDRRLCDTHIESPSGANLASHPITKRIHDERTARDPQSMFEAVVARLSHYGLR